MNGISLKAIVVGGVTDVALSSILGIPLGIYVIASRSLSNLPKDQLQSAFVAAVHGTPALYAVQIAIGVGCSVLGGFIAAWIAKERHLLNGILAAWLCVGMGLYTLVVGKGVDSVPVHLALIALTPLCYFVGAKLRFNRFRTERSTA